MKLYKARRAAWVLINHTEGIFNKKPISVTLIYHPQKNAICPYKVTINITDNGFRFKWMEKHRTLPLNKGDIDHTTTGLFPVNWPKETSKKYRGTPHESSKTKKGIKKAPGRKSPTFNKQ
jgi:hypothetical protein